VIERDGHKFDFETQRFLINRWQTETGKLVREQIIDGIKNSLDISAILSEYVLDHPDNTDPYAHPIYPKSEMQAELFWVLNSDDLRGIHITNEQFPTTSSLEHKMLTYSHFFKCDLSYACLNDCELSYARFKSCEMNHVSLIRSGGFSTSIINCNLRSACLWQAGFIDAEFMDSNFNRVYLESAFLKDIQVNYRTQFDRVLRKTWQSHHMPAEQQADVLRSIRIAYQKAELWGQMDAYLYQEKVAQRKYIAWPNWQQSKQFSHLLIWFYSLIASCLSGYSTKPFRVVVIAACTAMVFALIYFIAGSPSYNSFSADAWYESLYFSFTTFATLGYGDVSYSEARPFLRLLSTIEAWVGAVFLSLYVVVLSRKALR
jgi:hypothetical protein